MNHLTRDAGSVAVFGAIFGAIFGRGNDVRPREEGEKAAPYVYHGSQGTSVALLRCE